MEAREKIKGSFEHMEGDSIETSRIRAKEISKMTDYSKIDKWYPHQSKFKATSRGDPELK